MSYIEARTADVWTHVYMSTGREAVRGVPGGRLAAMSALLYRRGADALLIVDDASDAEGTARELSEALRRFSVAGPDGDDASWNFWEATGGRATLRTDPNRAPMAAGVLPDRTLAVDGVLMLDLSAAFADPDGDPLVYTGVSSVPQVAAVTVSGAQMRLRGVTEGTAAVEVTATDPDGLFAARRFTATVTTSPPFTDDPIVLGVTPVRAAHFTELRGRIDALRRRGLASFGWTDTVLPDLPTGPFRR